MSKPSVTDLNDDPSKVITSDEVNYKVNIRLGWDIDKETVTVPCRIMYFLKSDNSLLLTMEYSMTFIVTNFKEIITTQEHIVNFPDALLIDIFNTTVNTARGYIYATTEKTLSMKDVILGTFNPMLLLDEIKKTRPHT